MKALFLVLAVCLATAAGAQPLAYAWRLDCPNLKRFGPFGTPDACREGKLGVAETCEQPTQVEHGKTVPSPAFVRIADICAESLNGRGCDCVYAAYPAKSLTVLDLYRAVAPVP